MLSLDIKQKIFSLPLILFSLFFLSACGRQQSQPVSDVSSTSAPSSFSGSVKDLLDLGKNLKCLWTFENEQNQMSGTVYVSGQKSRTDMLVNAPQTEDLNTHFISDGQTAYSWTDGQPQGFKFAILPDTTIEDQTSLEHQQYQDWLNDYEYRCSDWSVDDSLFQTPEGIKFVDLNQQVQDLKDKLGGVCDQLPSPQKEECLDNLQ